MGRDGAETPWDQKLITVATEEAIEGWKQPWLEHIGAHNPATMLRRASSEVETPQGKRLFCLSIR